ncbi:TrmH family RNA methyltransferase [Bacteroidota bacterium]
MLTRNQLKYYSTLLQKKYRTNEKKIIAEGKKVIDVGLNSNYKCELIICTELFYKANLEFLKSSENKGIPLELVKNNEFKKLSDTKSPQGIVSIFQKPDIIEFQYQESMINIALETINDPGNLGTIIRTCDWFGIKNLILSKDCADAFSPKVIRSTAGSIFNLNISTDENFYERLNSLRGEGFRVTCADLNGISLFDYVMKPKLVLVFCNESRGPSAELRKIVDDKITIPKIGGVESLNVASASAIIISNLIYRNLS